MLEFDPIKHHYFWDGKRVPGVSEIIKAVGLGRNYESVDTFYRDRGIATHKAIQLYIDCKLDEESLDPVILPYFNQARKWYDDKFEWGRTWKLETEVMKYSEKLGVAGTIDFISDPSIFDWKCTKSVDPIAEIQGAFYKVLTSTEKFYVIQLDGSDEPAKEIEYEAGPELVDAVMILYRKWKKK